MMTSGKQSAQKVSEEKMEQPTNMDILLTELPDDILYHIISFLDVASLGRICHVCRFFRFLASKNCVWNPHVGRQTVRIENRSEQVNQSESNQQDQRLLNCKSIYKASENWKSGAFKGTIQVSYYTRLIPWLQRDEQLNLWLSTKNVIRCFRVHKNGNLREWHGRQLFGLKDDVSKFVIKDNITVSGCRDGSVCGWNNETSDMLFQYNHLHASETHCVDFYGNTVVSGSRDKTVKVVSMFHENPNDNIEKRTINLGDRVWSLKISPCGSMLATGTAGNRGLPALTTWDLNSGEMLASLDPDHQKGAGVIDMKFEDRNTLLTCGYDTRLRMWDLRTDTCVASWTEPFDSAVFCFETDNNVSMVTGTARYGMTRLWDKRKQNPIQQYYIGRSRSSPVYSLTFDPGRLYVALDLGLYKLDFM